MKKHLYAPLLYALPLGAFLLIFGYAAIASAQITDSLYLRKIM